MHDNILLQIELDEIIQQENENYVSKKILTRTKKNELAFRTYIPNLLSTINKESEKFSIFVNKNKKINIFNKLYGYTIYSSSPDNEIKEEVSRYLINHKKTKTGNLDALVIEGVGIGYHIYPLIKILKPNSVILYENENDFLKISFKTCDWLEILEYCAAENITLFIQNSRYEECIENDLYELEQHIGKKISYITYHHLVSTPFKTNVNLSHAFFPSIRCVKRLSENIKKFTPNSAQRECFTNNIIWLKNNYYSTYLDLIKDPGLIKLVINNCETVLQLDQQRYFENNNKTDKKHNFNIQYELVDPIVFDEIGDKKLENSFLITQHKFIKKVQEHALNLELKNEKFIWKELILIGCADFESCRKTISTSDNIILVETNLGVLKSSLYFVEWFKIKNIKVITNEKDLYKNIEECYAHGTFGLIETRVHLPYHEKNNYHYYKIIQELIQSTNGKSNSFEKQISSFTKSTKNLLGNSKRYNGKKLTAQCPVVIVGNGPSLDSILDNLVKFRTKVLVVSCGTALSSLLRQNIIPDYHMELENEKHTFNYLKFIAPDILKQLTLISSYQQHPEIVNSFKNALLVNINSHQIVRYLGLNDCAEKKYKLKYSYYTVTNFAIDFILTLGFSEIYLAGTDFGFIEKKLHHAKQSIYFNSEGKELYDFELNHGVAYAVKGNFAENVFTIPAFDKARLLMSDCIMNQQEGRVVYNLNDGAEIVGSIPLKAKHAVEKLFSYPDTTLKLEQVFQDIGSSNIMANYNLCIFEAKKLLLTMTNCWLNESKTLNLIDAIYNQYKILNVGTSNFSSFSKTLLEGSLRYYMMVSLRILNLAGEAPLIINMLIEYWNEYLIFISNKLDKHELNH